VYAGRDPKTGSPLQEHRTFKGTKRDAQKALAAFVTEVSKRPIHRKQVEFNRRTVTVGELLDRWLDHIEAIGKARPKTLYEYKRKIEGRIRPAIGGERLANLQADTLDALYEGWLAEGLSPSTVRVYHSILSAACRQAVKWEWLDRTPTERASPPAPRSPVMRVPTPKQLGALVKAAEDDDPVLAAAIALAALTGARRGELVALRWSDVDLEAGTIRIERAITVVDRVTIEGPTKTHQVRRVALDDIGVETLRRHWRFVNDRSQLAESPLIDDPFVLSYQAHCGTPLGGDTLTHRFSALCKKVDARAREKAKKAGRTLRPEERYPFHFHQLRHFSVTTLLAAGVDVRTVSERHGHAQATMTLNRYAHALPERDRLAAGVLGRALGNQ
jgi:integrase